MKSVFSFIGTGTLAVLVALTFPHERCAGKSGIGTKNIGEYDRALSAPQTEHCAHRVGRLWMSVTNWGHFGYEGNGADFTSWDCPRSGNRGRTSFPSAEYPGGSAINYLWQGALWIGAIVDDDTLVSVGTDGWNHVFEMYPGGAPYGGFDYRSTELSDPNYDHSALSEFDIIAEYADTLTDQAFTNMDPFDNRPHLPLGLKIVQESYSWSDSTYEDFIIFRHKIKNIGSHHLRKVFFGLYFDCDVWYPSVRDGYADDISGSYSVQDPVIGDQILVGWSADNDGDPNRGEQWDERSPRGVIGVTLLDFQTAPQQSFNWWSANGYDPNLDWGPRRQENNRDFGTGGLGTPSGDRNKYYIMSTPEKDYDQLWEAVDYTSQGWIPPMPQISHGDETYDTRFLLSFGAIDLAPGDSTEFAFVVAMGDNFHRNPTDFTKLFNWQNPQVLYDSLDFSDLTTNILAARELYRQLFVVVAGDIDRSGAVTVADAICLLNYLYLGGSAPRPLRVADVNGDCNVTLADAIYLLGHLFRGGRLPVEGCAP